MTYDHETRIARVITDSGNKKVRTSAPPRPLAPKPASPSVRPKVGAGPSSKGPPWSRTTRPPSPTPSAGTERYETPRVNSHRVVIEVTVTRVLGPTKPSGW
ncbi:pyridoxamine 5'-phosphate oxidase [Streptomyces roseoviridis]|uniref:pyridoxamine 5'-phosphate oxidase n=1 Tax=Streptomyces roseoviridis TaxID=67361 RepID=UPI00406BC6A7